MPPGGATCRCIAYTLRGWSVCWPGAAVKIYVRLDKIMNIPPKKNDHATINRQKIMKTALERFLDYVRVETTSQPEQEIVPSTSCQFDLAKILENELRELGLADAAVDEHCYVMATLPATEGKEAVPVIGWIAHLDTAPDVSGKNVNPQVIDYRGGEIGLSSGKTIPEDDALKSCLGHKLVTTDGTTLLGADNKAGIAAIMTALNRLIAENKPHGTLRVCFTPDEEVGNGTKLFDLAKFGAKYAYTVDGELPGELNRETFTAKMATITVIGREIHPGTAKGIMINAARVAAEIVALMPKDQAPETTEGYEPYLHPYSIDAGTARATIKSLLRSFHDDDMKKLEIHLEQVIEQVKSQFPGVEITLSFKEQYRNMQERLNDCPEVLEKLEEAARRTARIAKTANGQTDIDPHWKPIRGGTDGSRLTEMGLPTPNIYTGGHNFHSVTEWLSVNHLETTVQTLINLAAVWADDV